jgi:hypothetical protein
MSVDAGIEPRTTWLEISSTADRSHPKQAITPISNKWARSHPHSARSHPQRLNIKMFISSNNLLGRSSKLCPNPYACTLFMNSQSTVIAMKARTDINYVGKELHFSV